MRLWCLAATRQHLIFTFLSYDCVSRFNSALRSGKLSCVYIVIPCYIKRIQSLLKPILVVQMLHYYFESYQ